WGEDPVIGPALVAWAASLMQTGRLQEAEQILARADRTVRADLEPALGFLLNMVHGGIHLAQGRNADAIASSRAAEQFEVLFVTGSRLGVQLRCSMLHAMLGRGETGAVRDALAELSESERDLGAFREIRARLALASDDPAAAVEVLAPTLEGKARARRVVVLIRSLILEALAREALDETQAAQDAVERALDLAEPDALILPFLHIPSRELLERQPRHRTAHGAFMAEILDVISGGAPTAAPGPAAPLNDELSDGELRVLRFLPTNLTAADIASEIFVSVNTVKTHMRHIYAKLDAHTRVEAVNRARGLGLLGSSARHR
ncbi:MAG: hypothetical protein JOY58_07070, partial [Solirubrobacterales bacterium]|nr:hypothetical protein [Solirubrobacterales bacterium]